MGANSGRRQLKTDNGDPDGADQDRRVRPAPQAVRKIVVVAC
jgi:hypothetical protein